MMFFNQPHAIGITARMPGRQRIFTYEDLVVKDLARSSHLKVQVIPHTVESIQFTSLHQEIYIGIQ
jgi:hypothetical protein